METKTVFGGLVIFLVGAIGYLIAHLNSQSLMTKLILLMVIVLGIVIFLFGVHSEEPKQMHVIRKVQPSKVPEPEPEPDIKQETDDMVNELKQEHEEEKEEEEEEEKEAIVVEEDEPIKETEKIIRQVKSSVKKKPRKKS